MPELPEVETNARNLARWSVGRRIVSVTPPPGTRETAGVPARELVRRLEGRRVEEVTRRGKWILVRLSGGAGPGLGLHLGMTGKLARVRGGEALPRFTRAVLELDDGARICFVDSRRFGRLVAARTWEELVAREEIASVGPDALEIDAETLRAVLGSTRRTVKEAIMDQRKIGGIGNLYATEALWRARIHPSRPARKVQELKQVKELLAGIRAALRQGLAELAGSELPEYLEDGAPNPFYAYDRVGQRCRRCRRGIIRAIPIGGRTSAFCPVCQRR